jgi:hypothetical protein
MNMVTRAQLTYKLKAQLLDLKEAATVQPNKSLTLT